MLLVGASAERSENVIDGNADMNAPRKSDGFVVPAKAANNGGTEPPAEPAGGKGPSQVERQTGGPAPDAAPEFCGLRGLSGVRAAARKDKPATSPGR